MKYFNINDIYELRKTRIIILVNEKVYDFTSILDIHPGGNKAIINNMYNNNYNNYKFHNKSAKLKWKKYRIGSLYTSKYNLCCII